MSPLIGGMGGRGHGDFPTAIIEGPPGPPGVKGEPGKAGTTLSSRRAPPPHCFPEISIV